MNDSWSHDVNITSIVSFERIRTIEEHFKLTAPFDFRETRILALLASFGAFQTLLSVPLLIGTHVTFQGVA